MGMFKIDFDDGTFVRVEAPEDATDEEIVRLANRKKLEQRLSDKKPSQDLATAFMKSYTPPVFQPPEPEEDEGTRTGRFLRGVQAGAVGTFESAALGAATALDEDAELRARDNIQGIAGLLKSDDAGADTFAYQLGSGFGSFAGFVGAGIGAAALAPYAGLGALGAGIAGTATAIGLGSAAGAGEASERARAFGATEAERSAAARRGAAIGSLEGLPVGRLAIRGAAAFDIVSPIVNKIVPTIGKKSADIVGDRITGALGTAGIEGAQETASAILQNLNERGYNEEAAIIGDAFKEGGIGAIVGGTAGLLLGRRGGLQIDQPEDGVTDQEVVDQLAGTQSKIDSARQGAQLLEAERENKLRNVLREEFPKTKGIFTGEIRARLDRELGGTIRSPEEVNVIEQEAIAARQAQGIFDIPEDKVQMPVGIEQLNQAMRGETRERPLEVQDTDKLEAAAERAKAGIPALVTKEGKVLSDSRKDLEAAQRLGIMTKARLDAARELGISPEAEQRGGIAAEALRRRTEQKLAEAGEASQQALGQDQRELFPEAVEDRALGTPPPPATVPEVDAQTRLLRDLAKKEPPEPDPTRPTNIQGSQPSLRDPEGAQTDIEDVIAQQVAQEKSATVRKAREEARQKQEGIDVDTELGLREMQSRVAPKERNELEKLRNEIYQQELDAGMQDGKLRKAPERISSGVFAKAPSKIGDQDGGDTSAAPPVDARLGTGVSAIKQDVGGRKTGVPSATDTETLNLEGLGDSRDVTTSVGAAESRKPSALDNYGYRQSLPSQKYAEEKQKAAEGRAKKKGASSSAKKLVDGPQTGFIGTDPKKPLFLDTDFVAGLRGVNDEVVGPSNAKYKAIKKSVEKEGFDPDQKGSTVFIDINHKGEAFIAEGNNRAAVAKEFGIPSVKAEVRYYNGAEEVDSAVSPQNIIQNARPRPAVKEKPKEKPKTDKTAGKINTEVGSTTKRVMPTLDPKKKARVFAPKKTSKKVEANDTARDNRINSLFEKIFSRISSTNALQFSVTIAEMRDAQPWLSTEGKRRILKELTGVAINPDGTLAGDVKVKERLKPSNKGVVSAKQQAGRNAFQRYFGNYSMPENAIEDILYSMRSPEQQTKTSDEVEGTLAKEFFGGDDTTYLPSYGQKSAKDAYDLLMSLDLPNADVQIIQQIMDRQKISIEDMPIQAGIADALQKGDLKSALQQLQDTAPNEYLRTFLKNVIVPNIKDTKVKVQPNVQVGGVAVEGRYDPDSNTIILSKKKGMNVHALIHEATHAVTVGKMYKVNRKGETVLQKTPEVKQLEALREQFAEEIADTYGTKDVAEFVDAVMLDEKMQDALDDMITKNGLRGRESFVKTLIRMFRGRGVQTRGINELINAVVSPSAKHAGMRGFYLSAKAPDGARELLNTVPEQPIKADKNYFERVKSEILDPLVPSVVKRAYLNMQDAYILGQLAKGKIPEAPTLNKIINQMAGELRAENRVVDGLGNKIRELIKTDKGKKDYTTLSYLIPNATHRRIDPRAATFKAAWTPRKEDNDAKLAEATYKDLRRRFTNMSPEGQKLYKAATNFYESGIQNILDSLDSNLEAAGETDVKARKSAIEKITKALGMDKQRIRPFAPLERDGIYRLEYVTLDPTTKEVDTFVEYFNTVFQRKKAIKALDKYNAENVDVLPAGDKRKAVVKATKPLLGIRDDFKTSKRTIPNTVSADILGALKSTKAKTETVEAISKIILDNMPERSFLKGYIGRGDVRGFLGDVTPTGMAEQNYDLLQQLERKGRDYARQKVQLKYGAELSKFDQSLDTYNYKDMDASTKELRDKLLQISEFARAPDIKQWSRLLTSGGFAFTMGFNLSSASLTFFDVFMSASPYLSSRYGYKNMYAAYAESVKLLNIGGRTRKVKTFGADGEETVDLNAGVFGGSMSNTDFEGAKPDGMSQQQFKDMAVAAEVGDKNAVFNQTITQEMLEVGDDPFLRKGTGILSAKFIEGKLGLFNRWSSFMFHHSERFNREVVYMSSYMLELQKMRDSGKEPTYEDKVRAAEEAVDVTQLTLGSTAAAGRARYAQSGVGNVLFLFKRFAMSKYYYMTRMANDVIKSYPDTPEGKEAKTIARKQLARFLATSGLFAGVMGMPLMGAIEQVYNLFVPDEEDDFSAVMRKNLDEGIYGGALNAMLGVEMSSRISMNSLLYRPPIIDKDQSQLFTLLEQLGGPVLGQYLNVERGMGLINEGEIYRGVEAISPAFVRSGLRAVRFQTEGALTRRGDPVIDTNIYNNLMQGIGYGATDYISQLDINKNERRKDQTLNDKRKKLLRRFNMALTEGARDELPEIISDIKKYNRNLPPSARGQKLILPDSLRRSRRSFVATTQRMRGGMEFTPFMLNSLKEYDNGLDLFSPSVFE
jgi:hypothetical protein